MLLAKLLSTLADHCRLECWLRVCVHERSSLPRPKSAASPLTVLSKRHVLQKRHHFVPGSGPDFSLMGKLVQQLVVLQGFVSL